MPSLEKKLDHILFDEDISDIMLEEDMRKIGIILYNNSDFKKIIRELEESYRF